MAKQAFSNCIYDLHRFLAPVGLVLAGSGVNKCRFARRSLPVANTSDKAQEISFNFNGLKKKDIISRKQSVLLTQVVCFLKKSYLYHRKTTATQL